MRRAVRAATLRDPCFATSGPHIHVRAFAGTRLTLPSPGIRRVKGATSTRLPDSVRCDFLSQSRTRLRPIRRDYPSRRGVASASVTTESLRTSDRVRLRAGLSDIEIARRRSTIPALIDSLELIEIDSLVLDRAAQPNADRTRNLRPLPARSPPPAFSVNRPDSNLRPTPDRE